MSPVLAVLMLCLTAITLQLKLLPFFYCRLIVRLDQQGDYESAADVVRFLRQTGAPVFKPECKLMFNVNTSMSISPLKQCKNKHVSPLPAKLLQIA